MIPRDSVGRFPAVAGSAPAWVGFTPRVPTRSRLCRRPLLQPAAEGAPPYGPRARTASSRPRRRAPVSHAWDRPGPPGVLIGAGVWPSPVKAQPPRKTSRVLILDIGGSHVKAAFSDRPRQQRIKTGLTFGPEKMMRKLARILRGERYDAVAV